MNQTHPESEKKPLESHETLCLYGTYSNTSSDKVASVRAPDCHVPANVNRISTSLHARILLELLAIGSTVC